MARGIASRCWSVNPRFGSVMTATITCARSAPCRAASRTCRSARPAAIALVAKVARRSRSWFSSWMSQRMYSPVFMSPPNLDTAMVSPMKTSLIIVPGARSSIFSAMRVAYRSVRIRDYVTRQVALRRGRRRPVRASTIRPRRGQQPLRRSSGSRHRGTGRRCRRQWRPSGGAARPSCSRSTSRQLRPSGLGRQWTGGACSDFELRTRIRSSGSKFRPPAAFPIRSTISRSESTLSTPGMNSCRYSAMTSSSLPNNTGSSFSAPTSAASSPRRRTISRARSLRACRTVRRDAATSPNPPGAQRSPRRYPHRRQHQRERRRAHQT